MKQASKWISGVSVASLLLLAPVVSAEPMDGARILEMEAEKARQIEDLEYQAKLVEQKAKLAKAYKQLKESGGVIPGEEGMSFDGTVSSGATAESDGDKNLNKLPTLKSIGNGYAVFEHKGKMFRALPGGSLPGGFKVLSVSNTNGVRLQQGSHVYSLDIAWAASGK